MWVYFNIISKPRLKLRGLSKVAKQKLDSKLDVLFLGLLFFNLYMSSAMLSIKYALSYFIILTCNIKSSMK